jgi:hypothetical protein
MKRKHKFRRRTMSTIEVRNEALEAIKPHMTAQELRILEILKIYPNGVTCREIEKYHGIRQTSAVRALNYLRAKNDWLNGQAVDDTQSRKCTVSHTRATAWRLKQTVRVI